MKNKLQTFTDSKDTVEVKISDNNLEAFLTIKTSKYMIDEAIIAHLLKKAKITNGIKEAAEYNKQNNLKKEMGKPFLIAKGTIPTVDSDVNYLFDIDNCIHVKENFNAEDLNKFEHVLKDHKLASINPLEDDLVGLDVFGNETKMGKLSINNMKDLLGENVSFSAKENAIVALTPGYPYVDDDNKINVMNNIFIKDNIIGKELKLFGNVNINGIVEDSCLQIEGNLTVNGNIHDCLDQCIFVNGDTNIEFVENARIISQGNIHLMKSARFSILQANKKITGSKESVISGGLVQSGENIELAIVGSPFPVETEIEITTAPYLKEKIQKLQKDFVNAKDNAEKNDEILVEISNKLSKLKKQYTKALTNNLKEDLSEFEIKINKVIYENSYFRIMKHSKKIIAETINSALSVKNGELTIYDIDKFS